MSANAAYFVDFDGTITTGDLSSELAAYFAGNAYMEIENKYRRREMPIRDWLQQMVKLLPPDLDLLQAKSLQWAKIRPGFQRFLDYAREQNSPVLVASDGFGFYIEPVLKKFGYLEQVSCIYRNDTIISNDGNLDVINPHAHRVCTVCGNCKAAHVSSIKEEGMPVIYIGDGSNDRFGASWSDHICARDKLAETCREFNLSYSPWIDFYDIIKIEKPELKNCSISSLCCPRGNGIKTAGKNN